MDTMEFIAVLNSKKLKVTGNSNQELFDRWITVMKGEDIVVKPEDRAYWMNRVKSSSVKYDKKKLEELKAPKLSEAWHASLAIFKQGQGEVVSQEEHNRRAAICFDCKSKGPVSTCAACGSAAAKFSKLIGGISRMIKTPISIDKRIEKLYCSACGCSLPLLTLTRSEYLPQEDEFKNRARPLNCWMRKSGPNFKP